MPYSPGLIQAAERTKATVVSAPVEEQDPDSPAYKSSAYLSMIDDVVMMREVAGGTKTMRAAGDKYLPQHPMEKSPKYQDRLKIAVAFNALARTINGLLGMVFRRDPVVSEEADDAIAEHLDNVDMRGRDLATFLRGVGDLAMRDGHAWIHVEAPRRDGSIRNRQAEREAGIRPYWIQITKAQAINWRYEIRAGRPVLTLFVYTEGAVEADGPFGEKRKERIRVLREVREEGVGQIQGELWELQEKTEKQEARWEMIDGPYAIDVTEIPIVFVPADPADRRTGEFTSEPPLRDLAYEQIEHYRVRSDRQKSLTFSSIAVPYAFGQDMTDDQGQAKVMWSPDGIMLSNDPNAKAGVIESHGYGLDATKEELNEIEGRMAALGLQMLVAQPGTQPTTATERILDKSEGDAALVLFANSLQMAANEALRLHGAYRRTEAVGMITLNRDFHDQLIDPKLVEILSAMVAEEKLSLQTMWALLIEGELLPEDFDPEEELEQIRVESANRMTADPLVQALRGVVAEDEMGDEAA